MQSLRWQLTQNEARLKGGRFCKLLKHGNPSTPISCWVLNEMRQKHWGIVGIPANSRNATPCNEKKCDPIFDLKWSFRIVVMS